MDTINLKVKTLFIFLSDFNKKRANSTLRFTWMRVPMAIAFDASCMRSAACSPNMWTPSISPVSGLYINYNNKDDYSVSILFYEARISNVLNKMFTGKKLSITIFIYCIMQNITFKLVNDNWDNLSQPFPFIFS